MLPDLRTPLLWILAVGCIALGGTAAIERTMAAKAKENLATEKLDRAKENDARNRAALRFVEQQIENLATHSTKQTEIANALQKQTVARAAADARNADLAARVQRTADQLAAAIGAQERRADAAAGGDQGHRPDPFAGLLAEGGQLLAEAGRVVAEGRSIVGRRDSEVRALTDVIANDRALCAAGEGVAAPATIGLLPAAGASLPSTGSNGLGSAWHNR